MNQPSQNVQLKNPFLVEKSKKSKGALIFSANTLNFGFIFSSNLFSGPENSIPHDPSLNSFSPPQNFQDPLF